MTYKEWHEKKGLSERMMKKMFLPMALALKFSAACRTVSEHRACRDGRISAPTRCLDDGLPQRLAKRLPHHAAGQLSAQKRRKRA
jgi:hypothetical protein